MSVGRLGPQAEYFMQRHFPLFLAALILALLPRFALAQAKPEPVVFIFALYFAPEPKIDPTKRLDELLKGEFRELTETGAVSSEWKKIEEFAPPTAESFPHFSVGLEATDREAMARSERVLGIIFAAPPDRLLRVNRLANTLVARLAEDTGAIPWDEECRLMYSPAEWRKRRVDNWQGDIPDVRGQVNMHAYRDPELVRIITLGMRKFNLPDLVMTGVTTGFSRSAGNTVNACAQFLLEGRKSEGAKLQLDFTKIRHEGVRQYEQAAPMKGATGRALVAFRNAAPQEGDPANRLWGLDFPEMKAATVTERQGLAFAALYGSEDKVLGSKKGDPEMLEASARARKDFLALEGTLRKGLQPNERLLVKKGFIFGDDTEYMWVEVLRWHERSLEGILANDSIYDDKVRHGQRVTVEFDDIYDYLHYKPDGTEAGNETSKVLLRREGK